MTDHRVIVTGSRWHNDEQAVWIPLALYLAENCQDGDTLTVVHGACKDRQGRLRGADRWAHTWCALPPDDRDVTVIEEPHPADWDLYGNAAGPIRNRDVVDLGAEKVFAFPLPGPRYLSRGTWDCIDAARAHGIPVEIIQPKEGA